MCFILSALIYIFGILSRDFIIYRKFPRQQNIFWKNRQLGRFFSIVAYLEILLFSISWPLLIKII